MSEPLRFALRGRLTGDASLARHTSWRVGGCADWLYVPADHDDLATLVRSRHPSEPMLVVGLGSNLLVRDGGFRGIAIVMHDPGAMLAVQDGLVYADAGAACPKLARFAARHDCAGAEFFAGIPGTVGGALAMNAGCHGGETWRHVARVEMLGRDGTFAIRVPDEFAIGYRHISERDGSPLAAIFTAAWFRFPEGDGLAARQRIRELLNERIATQPLSHANAGSVFRNPPGDYAARLIESCGLKGHTLGGAQVSKKHANFIVNPARSATGADIEALIVHVREIVERRTGVHLVPEVRIVGEP